MTDFDEFFLMDYMRALNPSALAPLSVSNFSFNPEFRSLCEANHCGHFNKQWMCPPHVGEVDTLVSEVKSFERAIVYQFIGELEHSMDWKGTLAAGASFKKITLQIVDDLIPRLIDERESKDAKAVLLLGCGPCPYCKVCAFQENEPCRHPDKAVRSLEANCVDVSALAAECGLKYINGPNTVTFFGSLLYKDKS
ncbi:MAG: DUF2284 domain-containing protein [Deltaproteobacteria bacterium]|jgi:predicted metal-binding protein|nr:DUF2284 domain-containing protein [Deltaproteobacteria bacterium]